MVFVNFLKQVLHHLNSCVGKFFNTLTNVSQAWVKYVKREKDQRVLPKIKRNFSDLVDGDFLDV